MAKKRITFLFVLVIVFCLSIRSTLYEESIIQSQYGDAIQSLFDPWETRAVGTSTRASTENVTSLYEQSQAQDTRQTLDHRPLFVLHVGPGKTGTTTIQWFAQEYSKLLEKDNFYYIQQDRHALARSCRSENTMDKCRQVWKEFHKTMKHHHQQGHNVFVSEEGFSAADKPLLEQVHVFDELIPYHQDFNVRVVYTYRRYFEWIPSKYAQGYNPQGPNKAKRSKWPKEGGTVIPSFSHYYESHQAKPFKHPLAYQQRWQQQVAQAHINSTESGKVHVFNMHMEGDLLTNFYCNMLPEAKAVCNLLLSKNATTSKKKNSSSEKTLEYDMIAAAAHGKNMIFPELQRIQVRNAIQVFANTKLGWTTRTDFPLECLSQSQTDNLLKQSMQMELNMLSFPNKQQQQQARATLQANFQEAIQQKLFCSVNVHQILQDKQWKEFFQTLNAETIQSYLT